MHDCSRIQKQIRLVLLGTKLTEEENKQLAAHLASCSQCREIYEREQKFDKLLQSTLEPDRLKRDLSVWVLLRLPERSAQVIEHKKIWSGSWFYTTRWVWASAFVAILAILITITFTTYYIRSEHQLVVKTVRGLDAFVVSQGNIQKQPVHAGMRLHPGDQLDTNQRTQVALQLGTGIRIWIKQKTRIQVGFDTSFILYIPTGEMFIDETQQKVKYRIQTPAGTIYPVGTSYDIQVAENSTTRVAVIDGKVQFINNTGYVVIQAGYGAEASVIQQTALTTPMQINPREYTDWVKEFKEFSQYSPQTRRSLAQQALEGARKEQDNKQYYAALTTFRRVTELMPEWASGYYGMGYCYANTKQYENAVSLCSQALAIDPNLSDARYYLAVSLVELGRDAEARPHAELLVKQVPNDHAFSILLGEIYHHLGYLNEAERWYRLGLTQYPCDTCANIANSGLKDIARKRQQ